MRELPIMRPASLPTLMDMRQASASALVLLFALGGGALVAGDVDAAPTEQGTAFGSHVVTRFWMPGGHPDHTSIVGIETPSGDLALYAVWEDWHGIYVTDGPEGDIARLPGRHSEGTWHRIDVILHGDTFTLTLDGTHSVSAATLTNATKGRPVLDPQAILGGDQEVIQARLRVDDADLAHDTTFAREPEEDGWSRFERWDDTALVFREPGDSFRLRDGTSGFQSTGFLEMYDSRTPGVAYLHAPTPPGGRYVAEAAYAPDSALLVPRGQAVLAGVTGNLSEPEVQWAVVADLALPTVEAWTLYFEPRDGERVQLLPPITRAWWHAVTVRVDEVDQTLSIRVEQGLPTTPVHETTFVLPDLGPSERIAAGDVSHDWAHTVDHLPVRGWLGKYDDLAVYPEVIA